MILILSDFDKVFGYFIPSGFDFEEVKIIDSLLSFYTIKNNQSLIICKYKNPNIKLISNEQYFIQTENKMMLIKNDRNKKDIAALYTDYWRDIRSGFD